MAHANEFAIVLSRRTLRAAKPHSCDACPETIRIGDQYERWILADDGIETIRQCIRCREIWSAIVELSDGDPVCLDLDCGERWEDVFGEIPPEVAALAFALPGDFEGSDTARAR